LYFYTSIEKEKRKFMKYPEKEYANQRKMINWVLHLTLKEQINISR